MVVCPVTLAIVLLVLILCRPRKPTWRLSELVVDAESLKGLVSAFTDPNFNSTKALTLDVAVDVWQPNFVWGKAGAGDFTVLSGEHVLAQVQSEPMSVSPRSHLTVKAHSSSIITPETSKYLMAVLPPAFKISPVVIGEVPATVFGFVSLTVTLRCIVDVAVVQILSDPVSIIEAQRCVYGFEF